MHLGPFKEMRTRLGRRLCVIKPGDYSMSDAVAFMTGASLPEGVSEDA